MSWQIPAGPPAQPTLVPWKTMQEELPNALGADDESLPDHCQCAPLKVIYYSQYCLGSANNSCTSQLAAPACSSQRKQSGHWSTMWVFFPNCFFWVISSLWCPWSCSGFQGNSQVVLLSKEGSNALLRNPCPAITAHFLSRARPSSGSFVVRNGPRDNSKSDKHCTWNGTWIHGFYPKMPQHSEFELPQPKEFHAQAALSHWKFRISFFKNFKKILIFFSVSEDTSAPLNTVIPFPFKD